MNATNSTALDNRDIFEKYPEVLVFLVVGCSILGAVLLVVCVYRCMLDYNSGAIRSKRVLPKGLANTKLYGVQNYQSKRFEKLRESYSRKDVSADS